MATWESDRFGISATSSYGAPAVGTPAPGARTGVEKANAITWTQDPEEIVKYLFKGAEGNTKGDYAKWCKDNDGHIKGNGPNCSPLEEEGERDTAECFYLKTMDCIQAFRDTVFSSTRGYIDTAINNKDISNRSWLYTSELAPTHITYPVQSLEPYRKQYEDAEETFKDCVERVKNNCECKRCLWDIDQPDDKPDEEEEPDTTDDTDDTPTDDDTPDNDNTEHRLSKRFKSLSTSSAFGIIPRIWGRYVVGGNIVWLGDTTTVFRERILKTTDSTTQTIDVYDTFVDFVLALSAGEANALLRVWFDDVLIVNKVIDITDVSSAVTDLDVSALQDTEYELTTLSSRQPTLEFYSGTSYQKVAPNIAAKQGFGKAPAHRDTVFLHFKNVNLALFGNGFPQIRVDFSTSASNYTASVTASADASVYPSYMEVDTRLGAVTTRTSADEYVVYDWDSLTETYRGESSFSGALIPLDSGALLRWEGGFLNAIDPTVSPTRYYDSYYHGSAPEFTASDALLARAFRYFDVGLQRPFDVVVTTQPGNMISYIVYDYSAESLTTYDSVHTTAAVSPATATVVADGMASTGGALSYYQFLLNGTTQSSLHIIAYPVVGTDDTLKTSMTLADMPVTVIAGASLWGSATTGVSLINVIHAAGDNSFLLFFSVGGTYKIAKLDIATMTVEWVTTSPRPLSPWGFCNESASRSVANSVSFISTDGYVIKLSTEDGTLTELGTLTSLSLPTCPAGYAQFYDGRTNSLTYLGDSAGTTKITRVFLERLSPDRVPLSRIVDDIADRYDTTRGIIDASDLSAITVDGYAVLDAFSVRRFFEDFTSFYQIALLDDGAQIYLVRRGTFSTTTTIDLGEDVHENTLDQNYIVDASLPDTVSVSFVTVSETGLGENLQIVSLRGEEELESSPPNTVEFTITVNESPTVMSQYAEQLLRALRSEKATTSVEFMPRMLALTPQDPISVDGVVYRIKKSTLSPSNHADVLAERFNVDDFGAQVSLSAATLSPLGAPTRAVKQPRVRPVVLFINALTDEDAYRSANGKQVVYTLTESGEASHEPVRVALRVMPHTGRQIGVFGQSNTTTTISVPSSDLYTSPLHTKAAHLGKVTSLPVTRYLKTDCFTPSHDDFVEVQFMRDDTLDAISALPTYAANYHEVVDVSTRNLLIIGNELIQFGYAEIVDAPTRLVRFHHLFRGVRGSETGMEHTLEETAYLYTSDTIRSMTVHPSYTKRRANARVFVMGAVPAGASIVDFVQQTDAGAARPWAPAEVNVYAVGGDQEQLTVTVRRRNPILFNQMENLGNQISVWGTKDYIAYDYDISPGDYYDLTYFYTEGYADAPVDLRVVNHADDATLETVQFQLNQFDIWTNRRVILAQFSHDDQGGIVVGYPLVVDIPAAGESTYPTAP